MQPARRPSKGWSSRAARCRERLPVRPRDRRWSLVASLAGECFGAAVEEAERLATRHARGLTEPLEEGHRPVRRCLPLLLTTFELEGGPAVQPLLAALG